MSYMASQKRNSSKKKHIENLTLAFELAKINLGSTNENPSVGCVVEKSGSIISSGYTSINGRPHAESNTLENVHFKKNKIYTLYSTLEPCCHEGRDESCVSKILKSKKINRVIFSLIDPDKRVNGKGKKILKKKKMDE